MSMRKSMPGLSDLNIYTAPNELPFHTAGLYHAIRRDELVAILS